MSQQNTNAKPIDKPPLMDRFRHWVIIYGDVAIRLFFSLIISYVLIFILTRFLHLGIIAIYLIVIVLSIAIAPLFSRVHLAEKILDWYIRQLNQMLK